MDIDEFNKKLQIRAEEHARFKELKSRYKKNLPIIKAIWDPSKDSIHFNDVQLEYISNGFVIYKCTINELWAGLYKPEIFEVTTLWKKCHDSQKIVNVINHWEQDKPLSPIFLLKHSTCDKALVADGKHRLTVSRAIGADFIMFMVSSNDSNWIKSAIPNAILIAQYPYESK